MLYNRWEPRSMLFKAHMHNSVESRSEWKIEPGTMSMN